MKRKIVIVLIILLLIILLLTLPILQIEYTTYKHFNEFSEYMSGNDSPICAQKMKVIDYSDGNAKVYFYTPYDSGDILYFTKSNSDWSISSWESYWSVSGNADRIVWPYWWHLAYFVGMD